MAKVIVNEDNTWVQVFPGQEGYESALEVGQITVVDSGSNNPSDPYRGGSVVRDPKTGAIQADNTASTLFGATRATNIEGLQVVPDELEGFEYGTGFGAGDASVEELQQMLVDQGYNLGSFGPLGDGVDGAWGNVSQAALDDYLGKRESIIETNSGLGVLTPPTSIVPPTDPNKKKDDGKKPWSGQTTASIMAMYPWASDLGLGTLIVDLVKKGSGSDEIYAEIRKSEGYKREMQGFVDSNGRRRFRDEAAFLQARRDVTNVLMDFGMWDPATDGPATVAGVFEAGIDSNELEGRLQTYRALETGSQGLRDAFYVHAGMRVGVDDLFEAVTSLDRADELMRDYDAAVANAPVSWETYVERAREVATTQVVTEMEAAVKDGSITQAEANKILAMDPQFGQELMGALAMSNGGSLSLEQVTRAYSYAVMGSAATDAGFAMPTTARLQEFVNAGIDSSKLRGAYAGLQQQSPAITGMMQRAGRTQMGVQEAFETQMLGQGNEIRYAAAAEEALGQATGGFRATAEGRRITQRGRQAAT
jgi:hypothetical protein